MRDVHVDVIDGLAALGEHLLRRADEHTGRELEDLASVHLDKVLSLRDGLRGRWRARPSSRQIELCSARAVGAELEAEEAAFRDTLDHDSPCAVAEEHGRAPVAPVED